MMILIQTFRQLIKTLRDMISISTQSSWRVEPRSPANVDSLQPSEGKEREFLLHTSIGMRKCHRCDGSGFAETKSAITQAPSWSLKPFGAGMNQTSSPFAVCDTCIGTGYVQEYKYLR